MGLAQPAAVRAGKPCAAIGGNLYAQFDRPRAGVETLADQPPRRRNPQPKREHIVVSVVHPSTADYRPRRGMRSHPHQLNRST